MRVKVLGSSEVHFRTESGAIVEGHNLFVAYEQEGTIGQRAGKFFVNQSIDFPKGLQIGSDVELSFNQYGKVDGVSLTK